MTKSTLLTLLLALTALASYGQSLTDEEWKLYHALMEYRQEKGLPKIPLSTSLTHVAQTHVTDLARHKPYGGQCNMHSWSAKGTWTACCYTGDHANAQCMWSKPRELTTYPGKGYELAFSYSGFAATAETVMKAWKGSPGHNSVIVNQGIWDTPWKAIGIAFRDGYAVAWFGHEQDGR